MANRMVQSRSNIGVGPKTRGYPYLDTGRRFDAKTPLYYYRARIYDPVQGRFISKDPIGFAGSPWNLYEYVGGRPTVAMDPTGTCMLDGQCGPDVGQWLLNQMLANRNHPAIKTARESNAKWIPYANIGFTFAFLYDFKLLVQDGGIWDFKRSQTFESDFCPTETCKNTVTLCGICFFYDHPGNIHYGYVAAAAGLADWTIYQAAGAVQPGGGGDHTEDTAAIAIGIKLWRKGGNLCQLIKDNKAKLQESQWRKDKVKDCTPCDEQYK